MPLCPRCKKEDLTFIPWMGLFWSCNSCGYKGPVALEISARAVLEALRKIPKGKVTTYKVLGKEFGLHPRTVAKILAKNKKPDKYPCYKVVASDGSLGGYSGRGGIRGKSRLLKKDGIEIQKGKVDLKRYGFSGPKNILDSDLKDLS